VPEISWLQRPLGATGPSVSRLTLGTSSWWNTTTRSAHGEPSDALRAVLAGAPGDRMSVIDTSNNYGGGVSELMIGDALRELGGVPDGILIATKLDRDMATGDFSGERMWASLAESLERLGLDSIPLLYLHDPESLTYTQAFALGGPVEALVEMKKRGIAANIGISGGPAPMLKRYLETGLFDAVISHNRFTLTDRSADALFGYAAANGIAVFNAAPYGSAPLAKWPTRAERYAYVPAKAGVADAIAAMGAVAHDLGVPLAAAALQFGMLDDRVTSTVVGINSAVQLDETLRLADHHVPDELWAELERLRPPSTSWQDPPGPSDWDDFPAEITRSFAA
jgi:D-threo-aldose 1-dehydrogenase